MGIQTRSKEKYTPGGVLKCNKTDQGLGARESKGAEAATLVTVIRGQGRHF